MVYVWTFAWFASGAIGSALVLEFGFRRNGDDIRVSDITLGSLAAALFGPVNMLIGIVWAINSLDFLDSDPVIFKARRK